MALGPIQRFLEDHSLASPLGVTAIVTLGWTLWVS